MTVEADAEHLVAFALVPVGAGEHGGPRVDGEVVVGNVGLDRDADVAIEVDEAGEHLEPGVTAGDALADLGVGLDGLGSRVVFTLAVRRRQPVETGEEREPREPRGLQGLGGRTPRVGAHADPQIVVRRDVRVDDGVADPAAQVVDDPFAEPVTRQCRCVLRLGRAPVTQWVHHPPRSVRARAGRSRRGDLGDPCSFAGGLQRREPLVAAPLGGHVLVLDALLEQHDTFEQRLGSGRATGDVHVDRDDLVDALGDRVAVPVRAATVGARSHRNGVLRLGHLLPEPTDGGCHLVGHGAGDAHEVGLARAGRQRDDAEAHDVVAGRTEGGPHLDGAAGETPLVHPQRIRAAHVEQLRE